MKDILARLSNCIERGKINQLSPFPADMKDMPGADELTREALNSGCSATDILNQALMMGMKKVGDKFAAGKAFIPDLLIAAKAMNSSMEHLKPFFESGEVQHKGILILGTVKGDLHDIGKNIVKMVLQGSGWDVIDLGVDVSMERFLEEINKHKQCIVGLSALLTTTMMQMKDITTQIKNQFPDVKVFVGGAPLSDDFNSQIAADGYFKDPQSFSNYLDKL